MLSWSRSSVEFSPIWTRATGQDGAGRGPTAHRASTGAQTRTCSKFGPMAFNIADIFEHTADAVPDRIALIDRDVRLTFAELDARSNRIAHALVRDHATYEPTRWA